MAYVSPDSAPGLPRQVSEAEIEAELAGEHGYVSPGSAPGLPRQVSEAEINAAIAAASTAVDQTYTTPPGIQHADGASHVRRDLESRHPHHV